MVVITVLGFGDKRTTRLLFLLVRTFQRRIAWVKRMPSSIRAQPESWLHETGSAHHDICVEMAGRAIRPPETEQVSPSPLLTPRTGRLRPAVGTPRS